MRRSFATFLGAILIGLLITPVAAQGAGKPAPDTSGLPTIADTNGNKLFDTLEEQIKVAGANDTFDVIVQFAGPADANAYASVERSAGPLVYKAQWNLALQGFSATMTRAKIEALARSPLVKSIEAEMEVHAFLNTATSWTGVNQARTDFGVDGDRDGNPASYSTTDVVVAIIDTGIDATHVDLDGGKVVGWRDEVNGKSAPYDDHGHGTHVSSISAGTGEGNAAYKGVAPGAALVGIKVLNSQGSGTTTQIVNGINWMIANKATYNIRAANMSLGASGCSNGTDSISTAVNNAVSNGIIMLVAAGNDGPKGCTIGAPAAAAQAITVGALYDPGEKGWVLAEFSSRGPTADGRIKPDIATPGRYITAAQANSGNAYITYSGTSMATPFMTGVVALMLDADNALTDAGVKNILYNSANVKDFGPAGKDVDYGYGINLSYYVVKVAGGFTGSFSDGLSHIYVADSLGAAGQQDLWTITVTDATRPIGIAMIMPNWRLLNPAKSDPDFDLYLLDPSGTQVASSLGTKRQEQILFQPTVTGTYTIKVYAYSGAGNYFFDASFR